MGSPDCAPPPSIQNASPPRLRSWASVATLSQQFWLFFVAAFFFDFGIGLYFFLFNLFLTNLHFNQRTIGLITGAFTLGNLAGTVPVGFLAQRIGLQKLLLFCAIATPLVFICRTSVEPIPGQIAIAFLGGLAMSSWPVCFAPTIAKLTTNENRVLGFSISFATGIGLGSLAALAGGFLPDWFKTAHMASSTTDGMRLVLICASLFVFCGVWPILHLHLGVPEKQEPRARASMRPYLARFLPVFALWSLVTGAFVPFAPIYFHQQLGLPLQSVGGIFSGSQLAQTFAVVIAPLLYRKAGVVAGIICAQLIAGGAILVLCFGHSIFVLIAAYLVFSAAQFGATPGFYSLIMSRVSESERSSASAAQNITGALIQAGSASLTGMLIMWHGYSMVFAVTAALSVFAAFLSVTMLSSRNGAGDSEGQSAVLVATE